MRQLKSNKEKRFGSFHFFCLAHTLCSTTTPPPPCLLPAWMCWCPSRIVIRWDRYKAPGCICSLSVLWRLSPQKKRVIHQESDVVTILPIGEKVINVVFNRRIGRQQGQIQVSGRRDGLDLRRIGRILGEIVNFSTYCFTLYRINYVLIQTSYTYTKKRFDLELFLEVPLQKQCTKRSHHQHHHHHRHHRYR